MRAVLTERFPDHGIFGEEAGSAPGRDPDDASGEGRPSRWCWVLDPIDGTRSFVTGKPLFGTLIALLYDGAPVLGIVDQAFTRERWTGRAGVGTTWERRGEGPSDAEPARLVATRPCASDLADAYMFSTTPDMFIGDGAVDGLPLGPRFERLRRAVRLCSYGADCYGYGLVALGLADLVCEADLKPYDYRAVAAIVEAAGGVVTDWEGGALRWEHGGTAPAQGEVLAAGCATAHAAALAALRGE